MALDTIMKGMVEEFSSKNGFANLEESKAFEYLVNFLAVTKYQEDAFSDRADFDSLVVDSKGQFGLDAIAFIINGNLVTSKDDIIQYAKSNYLDVNILFIQSKTSNKLESGDFLKTIQATKNFISNFSAINEKNENIITCKEIWDEIFSYKNYKFCNSVSPACHIIYAIDTDNFGQTELIESLISNNENDFKKLFSDLRNIKIELWGKQRLINYYKEITNTNTCNINFKSYIELDSIKGVNNSYIGYLPGKEYLKIITSDDGSMRRRIFYENVRDFQGSKNTVNTEISKTINNTESQDQFILLNNGVTIITKKITSLGSNNYELKDFQIVNGCQTSNVIFNSRDKVDNILVPVKIIATEDTNIITNIVKATNRQTPVPEETFIVLSEYHKNIQLLFNQYQSKMPIDIVYERRAGEYPNFLTNKYKINLHNLIRSVTCIFFQDPHVVYNNNPAIILKNRTDKLFKDSHPIEMYYISAYLFAYLQKLINEEILGHYDFTNKYYILTVLYIMLTKNKKIRMFESKEFSKELDKVMQILFKEDLKQYYIDASNFVSHKIEEYKKQNEKLQMVAIRKLSDFRDFIFESITPDTFE